MAFKNTKTAEEPAGTNVVKLDEAVPAHIARAAEEAQGRGLSQDQSDNLIPLIYILQPLSPQLDPGSPSFIEGATPGDIWLRNHPEPIVRGTEGITFQWCAWSKDTVEWRQRKEGGGFVARHAGEPKDVEEAFVDPQNKNRWLRRDAEGHVTELMETRYHYGFANGSPAVLTFTSTGHTVSRDWMAKANAIRVGGRPIDAWMKKWRLKTLRRQNQSGTWYVFAPSDAGWANEEEVKLGAELFAAVEAGLKQAAEPDHAPAEEETNKAGI